MKIMTIWEVNSPILVILNLWLLILVSTRIKNNNMVIFTFFVFIVLFEDKEAAYINKIIIPDENTKITIKEIRLIMVILYVRTAILILVTRIRMAVLTGLIVNRKKTMRTEINIDTFLFYLRFTKPLFLVTLKN